MSLKQRIEQDLKAALLSGDSLKVDTLRGVKSAILNEEVAKGLRDTGLGDDQTTVILIKEAKKRQESAELYQQGGNNERAEKELKEKAIISEYLPEQMSEDEISSVIDGVLQGKGQVDIKSMGEVIGIVKSKVGASADGATVARLVKERLQ